jgi:hypothetical protein
MNRTWWLAIMAGMPLSSGLSAQVDGSNTEVSAAVLLRDYLIQSRYPEENRLLNAEDEALEKITLIPGDASHSADILGFSGDKLSSGSLLVAFTVNVRQPGTFSFRTYLQSDKGNPLVHTIVTRVLQPGKHHLTFLFYGKAIRDTGHSSHFTFSGIAGEKVPDATSGSGRLKMYQMPYQTQQYRLSDFTAKDWDSPQKRARIRELQQQIKSEKR